MPALAHRSQFHPREACQSLIRKAQGLDRAEVMRVLRRPWVRMRASMSMISRSRARNHGSILQAAWISSSVKPRRMGLADLEDPVGHRCADCGADGVLVIALADAVDLDLIKSIKACLKAPKRLLQLSWKVRQSPWIRRQTSWRWSERQNSDRSRGISRRRSAGSW